MTPATALGALHRRRDERGGEAAASKLSLLGRLAAARLAKAQQVRQLHETLCFLRAYPDDARVLATVERMLARFARRADLRAHRDALAHSGIAGTTSWFPYFWPTACWLARCWPRHLRFDRNDAEAEKSLARALPLLVSPLEAAALRELKLAGFAAIDRLRAPAEGDAAFLVGRVAALAGDDFTREAFYDAINPSCELPAAPGTPARTGEKFASAPVVFRAAPLRRDRPDLRAEMRRPPRSLRRLSVDEGARLIELARGAMVARSRDLDAFAYGNARDAWLVDDGDGLAFAFNGVVPQRRAPLAAVYGGLTLVNGVPVGYLQADIVGRAAALSFNTFDTFRGGEAARHLARLLSALRHTFGTVGFSIEPYQLGRDNAEGIDSGAWWFYFKLGFRPRAAAARRLVVAELDRMKRRPTHRTSPAVLRQLAGHHLFFDFEAGRRTLLPPLAAIGLRVSRLLAARHPQRATALAEVRRDAMAVLGLRSLRGLSEDEQRVCADFVPLVLLAGATRWPPAERRALLELLRAKAADSERDYVRRFVAHPRFWPALQRP